MLYVHNKKQVISKQVAHQKQVELMCYVKIHGKLATYKTCQKFINKIKTMVE